MALKSVKVLDLSRLLPGPYATQLLVDLGAQVTKVENSEVGGDPLRHYPPFAKDGQGAMFHSINRGKKSVALPFRDPSTPLKLHTMIQSTDVLVESFRPGTLEKLLNINHVSELLEGNPKLVVVRITGFGEGCNDPGHDINFMASAGVLGMMSDPSLLPVQFADLAGGSWPAALQIVASLYQRDNQTSSIGEDADYKDRLLEVKMALGARGALVLPLARRAVSGEKVGNGRDFLANTNALYGVFKTQCGGHVAVGCLEAHFWSGLCKLTGVEEYPLEVALTDPKARQEISAALLTQSADYWEEVMVRAGVPVTKVVSPEEATSNLERLTGDKLTIEVNLTKKNPKADEPTSTLALPRLPIGMGAPSSQPAPRLGQDNEEFIK